jgi:hypothetical protein
MGIGPTLSAWKAEVLPLNYTRFQKTENGGQKTETNVPLRDHYLIIARSAIQTQSSVISFLSSEMVEEVGFEPTKAVPSDLQSDPFNHSGTPPWPTH